MASNIFGHNSDSVQNLSIIFEVVISLQNYQFNLKMNQHKSP